MLTLLALALSLQIQAQADERTIWGLTVNQVQGRDVELVLRSDGPWLPVDALEREGLLHLPSGRRETIDGRVFVALSTLAPAIRFDLDQNILVLHLTAAPDLLAPTEVILSRNRPIDLQVGQHRSLYFNYAATYTSAGSKGTFSNGTDLFGQIAASLVRPLAFSTTFAVDLDGRPQRGLTYVTYDQPRSRRRWIVGDLVGFPTTLGSSPLVGGFRVGTETGIDPYHVSYALPRLTGSVLVPSTASVFVDGREISTFPLRPGPFRLEQLPVTSGLGRADVVLTDASGRREIFPLNFYLNTTVLKRGEQQYHYLAGKERTNAGRQVVYGREVATASHLVGVTDSVSVGYQVEGEKNLVSGGPLLGLRVWRAGTITLSGAASQAGTAKGQAGSLFYEFISRTFSMQARVTQFGRGFSNLFLPTLDKPRTYLDLFAGFPLGRMTLNFGARTANLIEYPVVAGQPAIDRLGVRLDPPRLSLSALGNRRDELSAVGSFWTGKLGVSVLARQVRQAGNRSWEGGISVNIDLQGRSSAWLNTNRTSAGTTTSQLQISRPLPLGPGYGYRVTTDATELQSTRSAAEFDVRHSFGAAQIQMARQPDGKVNTQTTLSGSVAMVGGRVGFIPWIDDGFAMVRIPGATNVRVYANHQYVGRTNGAGITFAPVLRSYLANSISISPDDVPGDVRLGAVEQQISPKAFSGTVVQFDATRLTWIAGSVRLLGAEGAIVPEYGTFELDGGVGGFSSPLNERGEFYLENVPPGAHRAAIVFLGERCEFSLTVPATSATSLDLGVLQCRGKQQ